jgi:hypothetical protein
METLILRPNGSFDGSSICYPVGSDMPQIIGYVRSAIERFTELYPMFKAQLGLSEVNLICRGSSGAIIASTFATLAPSEWSCNVVHVKKPGEQSHSGIVSCLENSRINVIIDDFICSGATIASIYSAVRDVTNPFFPIHCLIVTTGYSEKRTEAFGFVPTTVICSR